MNNLISIIIVNYNLEKEIEDCLDSLFNNIISKNHLHIEFEIIIVDNNSPNKILSTLEEKYKNQNVRFVYSERNLGFGKGCNLGAKIANGDLLVFLNPDTILTEDIFTPIIKLFKTDNSIGIVAPKQQVLKPFFDFSAGFFPNIFFEFLHLFGIGVFFEGFLMFILTKLTNKKFFPVDWILGAAIFIKKDVFDQVDGFDKDYFMFFEEVDLCKRVKRKNFKVIYYHSLKLNHIGSVSGKKNYFLYTVRTYASKTIFIKKHYFFPIKQLMIAFLYIQLFSQIIIWTLLLPVSRDKSVHKIKSFYYLLKNKLINKIDEN